MLRSRGVSRLPAKAARHRVQMPRQYDKAIDHHTRSLAIKEIGDRRAWPVAWAASQRYDSLVSMTRPSTTTCSSSSRRLAIGGRGQ